MEVVVVGTKNDKSSMCGCMEDLCVLPTTYHLLYVRKDIPMYTDSDYRHDLISTRLDVQPLTHEQLICAARATHLRTLDKEIRKLERRIAANDEFTDVWQAQLAHAKRVLSFVITVHDDTAMRAFDDFLASDGQQKEDDR